MLSYQLLFRFRLLIRNLINEQYELIQVIMFKILFCHIFLNQEFSWIVLMPRENYLWQEGLHKAGFYFKASKDLKCTYLSKSSHFYLCHLWRTFVHSSMCLTSIRKFFNPFGQKRFHDLGHWLHWIIWPTPGSLPSPSQWLYTGLTFLWIICHYV